MSNYETFAEYKRAFFAEDTGRFERAREDIFEEYMDTTDMTFEELIRLLQSLQKFEEEIKAEKKLEKSQKSLKSENETKASKKNGSSQKILKLENGTRAGKKNGNSQKPFKLDENASIRTLNKVVQDLGYRLMVTPIK
jgi:Fic family protein